MVRDARLAATVSHGNLVLLGTESWGDVRGLDVNAAVSAEQALDAGFAYADGRSPEDVIVRAPRLEIVPYAPQEFQDGEGFGGPVGQGYGHRLVWTFVFQRAPEMRAGRCWWTRTTARFSRSRTRTITRRGRSRAACTRSPTRASAPTRTSAGSCSPTGRCRSRTRALRLRTTSRTAAASTTTPRDDATTTLTGKYVNIDDTCGTISNSSPDGQHPPGRRQRPARLHLGRRLAGQHAGLALGLLRGQQDRGAWRAAICRPTPG